MICKSQTRATAAHLRNLLAPDLLAGGSPGCGRVPFRRLARGCRAVLVAGAAARAARRIRLAVPCRLGICRLAVAARRAVGPGDRTRDCRLRRAPSVLDRRMGAVRRTERARGPGPVRARVDGASRVRERTGRSADRGRPYLRLRRRRRRGGLARALRVRRGRRGAAGRAERERAALGEPALRLAGAPSDGLPLVDRALPASLRARRPLADRPLPRLRLVLGHPGSDTRRRGTASGAAGRAPSSFTPSSAGSATCL